MSWMGRQTVALDNASLTGTMRMRPQIPGLRHPSIRKTTWEHGPKSPAKRQRLHTLHDGCESSCRLPHHSGPKYKGSTRLARVCKHRWAFVGNAAPPDLAVLANCPSGLSKLTSPTQELGRRSKRKAPPKQSKSNRISEALKPTWLALSRLSKEGTCAQVPEGFVDICGPKFAGPRTARGLPTLGGRINTSTAEDTED